MRYIWSAIDSPRAMPKRRHPSRFSVFRRSTRWKNGIGELECSCGASGRAEMTARTDHGFGLEREDVCDMALAVARAADGLFEIGGMVAIGEEISDIGEVTSRNLYSLQPGNRPSKKLLADRWKV